MSEREFSAEVQRKVGVVATPLIELVAEVQREGFTDFTLNMGGWQIVAAPNVASELADLREVEKAAFAYVRTFDDIKQAQEDWRLHLRIPEPIVKRLADAADAAAEALRGALGISPRE